MPGGGISVSGPFTPEERREIVLALLSGRVATAELCRQHNAGLNILKTVLSSNEGLARAVRFRPAALRQDVVIPLCDLSAREGAREEPSEAECVAGVA